MSELPMIRSLPGYPWLTEVQAARRNIARITELEAALRPFAHLTKVEQARTAVIAEDDLITVVVRVGDIKAALAALSDHERSG